MVTDLHTENKRPLFSHKLRNRASQSGSWLCVGLDPDMSRLPDSLPRTVDGLVWFCKEIIAATSEAAAAFKINFAFFEALGPDGLRALAEVRAAIPADTPALADAKRGDIGSTAEAYARAILDVLDFDAMTANPYLGWDALLPFCSRECKAVFVLCKTSNPGAAHYQDLESDGIPLYLRIAQDALSHAGPAELGLVVGATQPEALVEVRSLSDDVLILAPGVGAQGASARDVMSRVGGNVLLSVSRGILYASAGRDFAKAAGEAAHRIAAEATKSNAV